MHGGGTIYHLIIVRCNLEGEANRQNGLGPKDNSRVEIGQIELEKGVVSICQLRNYLVK